MVAQVRLRVVTGPAESRELVFERHDRVVFGRSTGLPPETRLPETDGSASRSHFMLEVLPPEAWLRDLGSRLGTYVNGVKWGGRSDAETVEEGSRREYPVVDLHDGDEIRAGHTRFHLRVVPPEQPVAALPSRAAALARDGSDPHRELLRMIEAAGRPPAGAPAVQAYAFERKLGCGGFGCVYLVRHRRTRQRLALKVMTGQATAGDDAARRFTREIDFLTELRHPNIVAFYATGATAGTAWLAMEYCDGGSIQELLERSGGKLPLGLAGPIILEALTGLELAHRRGYVHRDLKPGNLLRARSAASWVTKVGDLGLARKLEEQGMTGRTATGTSAGTPPFMPREQLIRFKDVAPTGDVWSLGATFYVMLTGQLPRVDTRERRLDPIRLVLEGAQVPIQRRDPTVPAAVAEVIDRALETDPRARYQDAGEMRRALERAL
jgi:serine/threonine protein kinase